MVTPLNVREPPSMRACSVYQRWPAMGGTREPLTANVYHAANSTPLSALMSNTRPCPDVVGSYHAPDNSVLDAGASGGAAFGVQRVFGVRRVRRTVRSEY